MTGSINATKILLKEIPKTEKTTQSGIILPEAVIKSPSSVATAVLVGEGIPILPMKVKVGDKVLFMPHAVSKVEIPDEGSFLLLDNKDVLYIF